MLHVLLGFVRLPTIGEGFADVLDVALAEGTAVDKLPGISKFKDGKKKVEMNAILLPPDPITKANLDDVIKSGWIKKDEACAGAKDVPACK